MKENHKLYQRAEIIEEPKVETKFEKGKWYKINNAWYAKHECIHGSGRYWRHGDRITIRRDFHNKPGNLGDNWKDVSIVLLEDLSEIQQYLPADHPDKIKQEVKEEVKPNITWKIGDYVVFTEDWCRSRKGDIDKIKNLSSDVVGVYLEKERLAGSPLHKECKLKVFPTLQEAQKFSNELLGKSKTNLNVEDLIEGEIYYLENKGWTAGGYIFIKTIYTRNNPHICIGKLEYSKDGWDFWNDKNSKNFRLAAPSEKKWLKTCIKQDKFIPKEDLDKYDDEGNLMESKEYPEYYECVNIPDTNKNWVEGKIYKIRNSKQLESYENFIDEAGEPNGFCPHNHKHFKPSTKEAYDAQFKKDEEFKVGDKVICIQKVGFKVDGGNYSEDLEIGKLYTVTYETRQYGSSEELGIDVEGDGYTHPISNFRKALPHEIPVENSTIITGDYDAGNLVNLLKPLSTLDYNPIYKWQLEGKESKKKIPDLIDKSKVEVKIKRTKVKQIKL